MSVSIDDLQPKPFKVTIKGLELECKPPRLSHTLTLAKLGNIFQNTDKASKQDIVQAETDLDEVIGELIPELKGVNLDMSSTLDLVSQIMENIQPSDNKELEEKGVSFDTDPKA